LRELIIDPNLLLFEFTSGALLFGSGGRNSPNNSYMNLEKDKIISRRSDSEEQGLALQFGKEQI
jgi:hypothetical protein